MKKVSLLIISTNKYTCFLSGLLDSANLLFLKDCDVTYNIFTDQIEAARVLLKDKSYFKNIRFFRVEHRPFPYTTLFRFHFFKRFENDLKDADYNFYIDADCLIKKEIKSDDILSERTCVQHCGYVGERGTYETDSRSTSYIPSNEGKIYFGGGFWGLSNDEFWKFINQSVKMIDIDQRNGIVPVWHDESVLNRYMATNHPTKILTPSYHYPEAAQHIHDKWRSKGLKFECSILLLDKNHEEIRKD